MSLRLHQQDGEGGVEPRPATHDDWRTQLRSRRWGRELDHGRLPDLKNPEMNPTSRLRSVLFWAALAAATFVILIIGYSLGIWHGGWGLPVPS